MGRNDAEIGDRVDAGRSSLRLAYATSLKIEATVLI